MDIPVWIQLFVITGIILVIFVVPIRILWEMTRGSRDRKRRIEELADRLRERFNEVEIQRSLFGADRVRFKHEGRVVSMHLLEDDEVLFRLEPKISPKFPCVIKTKGGIVWPIAWEGMRPLSRIPIHDPLLDDAVLIYTTPIFGGYLREAALAGIPLQGKPKGITESIIVLRRMPGVRRFRLMMSEDEGFRILFRLRTHDLVHRPDEVESAIHHLFALYDALVMY